MQITGTGGGGSVGDTQVSWKEKMVPGNHELGCAVVMATELVCGEADWFHEKRGSQAGVRVLAGSSPWVIKSPRRSGLK